VARCSGVACGLDRHASALFAAARRLLFAADKRCVGCREETRCILKSEEEELMPKFLIEREIPGAGSLSQQELKGISQTSCNVLRKMGPQIQWLQSYVTGDKIYCVYIAPNEEMIREHASQGGFPANRISEIKTIIDPTTAEQQSAAGSQRSATGRVPQPEVVN